MKATKKQTQYIVVSKEGMTPFATESNLREARKSSTEAKRLGLSGEIVQYVDGKQIGTVG